MKLPSRVYPNDAGDRVQPRAPDHSGDNEAALIVRQNDLGKDDDYGYFSKL
jgi:hypothetical protein